MWPAGAADGEKEKTEEEEERVGGVRRKGEITTGREIEKAGG